MASSSSHSYPGNEPAAQCLSCLLRGFGWKEKRGEAYSAAAVGAILQSLQPSPSQARATPREPPAARGGELGSWGAENALDLRCRRQKRFEKKPSGAKSRAARFAAFVSVHAHRGKAAGRPKRGPARELQCQLVRYGLSCVLPSTRRKEYPRSSEVTVRALQSRVVDPEFPRSCGSCRTALSVHVCAFGVLRCSELEAAAGNTQHWIQQQLRC